MIKQATLDTLARLEQEMAQTGRSAERDALLDVMRVLRRSPEALVPAAEVAARFSLPVGTVEFWIERRTLSGTIIDGQWYVTADSLDRFVRIHTAMLEIEEQGIPTIEEVAELYARQRPSFPGADSD